MKLPSFKQIFSTDFPKEFKKLVDQLSLLLNNPIGVLYTALNNNLSLRDNLNVTIKDVLVTVDSSGAPLQSTAFTLRTTTKVDGVIVILAINQVNSAVYPTGGVFISGVQGATSYTINNITGLQPNQEYSLRVVAFQQ